MDAPRPADAPRLYDAFAERFEQHASSALWNAEYDRPAVLSLLGGVRGDVVLDAGCGPGLYAEELIERGASVIAVDASERMVERARLRLGDRLDERSQLRVHDLNDPMPWVGDGAVDAVVSALVWHYLDDRLTALREFHRVLRDVGPVVISCGHPTDDWLRKGGSYFEVAHQLEHWTSLDATFASWHLPLTVLCAEFADAGFVIERLVEPRPTARAREIDPDEHERLDTAPGFIVFRLRKA